MRIMVVVEGAESGTGRLHRLDEDQELRMDVTAIADVMERLAENRYDAVIFHSPDRGLTQVFANNDVVKALLTGLDELEGLI